MAELKNVCAADLVLPRGVLVIEPGASKELTDDQAVIPGVLAWVEDGLAEWVGEAPDQGKSDGSEATSDDDPKPVEDMTEDELRAELDAAEAENDGRWGIEKLREKVLDLRTAPEE